VVKTPIKSKDVASKRVEHTPVGKKSTGKSTISQMKTCDATDDHNVSHEQLSDEKPKKHKTKRHNSSDSEKDRKHHRER
jgi:hypothetical protein